MLTGHHSHVNLHYFEKTETMMMTTVQTADASVGDMVTVVTVLLKSRSAILFPGIAPIG